MNLHGDIMNIPAHMPNDCSRLDAITVYKTGHRDARHAAAELALAADADIERLTTLADSEGTRAVEYLRRARKAEAKIVRLTEWMAEQGLLHHHDHCRRPDGTNGPAWVVRKPAMVSGGSCEAWHADSAADAVNLWLTGC